MGERFDVTAAPEAREPEPPLERGRGGVVVCLRGERPRALEKRARGRVLANALPRAREVGNQSTERGGF